MNALLFPKGQNTAYLVYGSVFFENEIELSVNEVYEKIEDAHKCRNFLVSQFPENSDIGIQEHIVNNID